MGKFGFVWVGALRMEKGRGGKEEALILSILHCCIVVV